MADPDPAGHGVRFKNIGFGSDFFFFENLGVGSDFHLRFFLSKYLQIIKFFELKKLISKKKYAV